MAVRRDPRFLKEKGSLCTDKEGRLIKSLRFDKSIIFKMLLHLCQSARSAGNHIASQITYSIYDF